MEDPASWSPAERVIDQVRRDDLENKALAEPRIGSSLPHRIAAALRAEGLLMDTPVYPDPAHAENGRAACNAPLAVHGVEVAYCEKLVLSYSRGYLFWRLPAGAHRGPHLVTWR